MPQETIRRTRGFWDRYFMDVAARTAQLSKDPDRKVGAVLVSPDRRQMSVGYNGFPAGTPDALALLYDKEEKNRLMVHAEENALKQAPFMTWGCHLYVTRFPCERCAELIEGTGVKLLVAPRPDFAHPRWGLSWQKALQLFRRGDVFVTWEEGIQL